MPGTDQTVDLTPQQLAAAQLGGGVPKRVTDNRPKVQVSQLKAKPVIWHDVPQYPDQMLQAAEVKQVQQETYLLDLSKGEDMVKYREIKNLEFVENTNRYLLLEDRRFDEKTCRFVVYAEVGVFKFREFLPANLHGKN